MADMGCALGLCWEQCWYLRDGLVGQLMPCLLLNTSPASRLGVHKELERDTAMTADPS